MPNAWPAGQPIVWAVGTGNKAKIAAVFNVACAAFPHNPHVIFSFTVPSGVSDQPMTASETQTGAVNRAIAAYEAAANSSCGLTFADSQNRSRGLVAPADAKCDADYSQLQDAQVFTAIDFGVGLEGGVEEVMGSYYECGWMGVVARDAAAPASATGRDAYIIGIGSSARFQMSPVLMRGILEEKKELAQVMDELTGDTDVRSGLGAMGVLTAGLLPRTLAYEHGVLFALAPFLSDDKYWR